VLFEATMNTTIQCFAPRECLESYSGLKKIIKVIEENRLQQNEIIKIRKPGKSHRLKFRWDKKYRRFTKMPTKYKVLQVLSWIY
jgi:hypothetical protein